MTDGHDNAPRTDSSLEFSRIENFQLETVSPEILDRSRKNQSVILRAIEQRSAAAIAETMGVHDSTVSRFKSQGGLTFAARLLACAGLKVVPSDAIVYLQPDEFK